jgi:hypothetical protein
MANSVVKLLVNRLIGFLVFLALIIVLNILVEYTTVVLFTDFVEFLNSHFVFICWIAFFLVLGEIFILMRYPFNVPYPLFNSTGALLIVYFFADFFMLLMSYSPSVPDFPFNTIFFIAGILVFFIVLTVGYYKVFKNVPDEWKTKKKVPEIQEPPIQDVELEVHEQEPEEKPKNKGKKKTKRLSSVYFNAMEASFRVLNNF